MQVILVETTKNFLLVEKNQKTCYDSFSPWMDLFSTTLTIIINYDVFLNGSEERFKPYALNKSICKLSKQDSLD